MDYEAAIRKIVEAEIGWAEITDGCIAKNAIAGIQGELQELFNDIEEAE